MSVVGVSLLLASCTRAPTPPEYSPPPPVAQSATPSAPEASPQIVGARVVPAAPSVSRTPDLPAGMVQPPPKPPEILAFEDCATRVMRAGRGVGAVVTECKGQMEAYTASVDPADPDAIRLRAAPAAERPTEAATDRRRPTPPAPLRPGGEP